MFAPFFLESFISLGRWFKKLLKNSQPKPKLTQEHLILDLAILKFELRKRRKGENS